MEAALMDPAQVDFGFINHHHLGGGGGGATGFHFSNQILAVGYTLDENNSNLVDSWGSGAGSGSNSPGVEEVEHDPNTTLKFINDVLMEEDWEGKTCMFQDCLGALQAAEKSFSDALNGHDEEQHRQSVILVNDSISESFNLSTTNSQPEGVSFSNISEREKWGFDHPQPAAEFKGAGAEVLTQRAGGKQRDREADDDYGEDGRSSKYSANSPEESALAEEEVDDRFLLCDKEGNCNVLLHDPSMEKSYLNARRLWQATTSGQQMTC